MASTEDARQCCIFEGGKRCTNLAGATSLSKRARRFLTMTKNPYQISDKVEHSLLCLQHKDAINLLVPNERPTKRSRKLNGEEAEPQVNFNQLHMNTLKRYKRHYKLPQDAASKSDLVDAVSSHFTSQDVVEMETILLFTHMIKNNMNKFDQKAANGLTS